MTARLIALLLAWVLVVPASQVHSAQKPLKLTLTYTTIHGGLKAALLPTQKRMPRLGLALAGGGAKAAAAIGVLKVLEREGIPIAAIAGTSMGAGVGGLYAAGYSPDEIEKIFLANDWNDIFTDAPPRAFLTQEQKEARSRHLLEFTISRGRYVPPSGLSTGQKLTNMLAAKTLAASFEADMNFDKLKIPFRAVATDIETGNTVVLDHGLLHQALRASSAVPLVFQPVEIDGRLLVDGGLVNNLPVEVVKSMGAEVVIAVDSSTKLEKRDSLESFVEIMSQSISLQVRRESERQSSLADLVITPDTSNFLFTNFPAMQEIVKKGEEATNAVLPRIRELMRPKKTTHTGEEQRFHITRLDIQGNVHVSEDTIRSSMAELLPRDPSSDEALAALAGLYKLGSFADVSLELYQEGKNFRAVLTIKENPVVEEISIRGNTVISTDEVRSTLAWQQGQTLDVTRLSSALDAIVKKCKDRGYLLTRVERAGMKPDLRTLEIVLYEGLVDSITIIGQDKTDPALIRREMKSRVGQPLNFDTAAYDIQRLYALDYFESLSVGLEKSPRGGVDLTLRIKEKPTTKIRFGLRYDLADRFTGLTDFIMDNVAGQGIKMYLTTRYGNYTDLAAGYISPFFLNSSFVHTMQVFYQQRNYFIYEDQHKINELDIRRTGAEFAFGYQWFRFGDSYLRYRYSADSSEETLGANPSHTGLHIGSLAFLTTVDTRDKSAFPRSGVLIKGSYEMAEQGYGSTNAFTKTSVFTQGNIPMGERHTLIIEGSGGLGTGIVPYEEKFGIGGADYLLGIPLMGYQRREFTGENELGFSASYQYAWKYYQLKAVKALYLRMTAQAANVWDNSDAMSLGHLRNASGIGLHADTILGPMRLDFGMGEQRRYTIYFSAGFDY